MCCTGVNHNNIQYDRKKQNQKQNTISEKPTMYEEANQQNRKPKT